MSYADLVKKAESGDAEAMLALALELSNKEDSDPEIAFSWLEKAANLGNAQAQYELAELYRNVMDDDAEAFKWMKKAAENGNTSAKYNLPTYYLEGKVTPQDNYQAFHWAEQAANDGYIKAKTKLGAFYIEGIGVSPNKEKGLSLLYEAAASGDELAKEVIQEVTEENDSPSVAESYEVATAKKEIKVLLICSAICFILGTIIGASGGNVLLGMWFGIGIGGALSFLPEVPGIFKIAYREEGFVEALKSTFLGGGVWFLIFMIAGPIGLLIRILKKNNQIKNPKE